MKRLILAAALALSAAVTPAKAIDKSLCADPLNGARDFRIQMACQDEYKRQAAEAYQASIADAIVRDIAQQIIYDRFCRPYSEKTRRYLYAHAEARKERVEAELQRMIARHQSSSWEMWCELGEGFMRAFEYAHGDR